MRVSASVLCFLIALASGPATAQTLVYRVDQATAVLDGAYLVVRVKGAAKTGGWEHPRLVAHHRSAGDLVFQFVATPPEDSAAVVQQVVPVRVSVRTRAPGKSVAAVRVVSQTNSVTAQIIAKRQRTAQK